jgi:hypothetical protein
MTNRAESSYVKRWGDGLFHVTGCSPREIAERLDVLQRFCAEQRVSPQRMIDECLQGPDRMARRAFYLSAARNSPANLIIQSFLVHNGINVFGELVCIPGTTQAILKEQGEQWLSRRS